MRIAVNRRNGTCKGIYTHNKQLDAEIIGLTHGHGVKKEPNG